MQGQICRNEPIKLLLQYHNPKAPARMKPFRCLLLCLFFLLPHWLKAMVWTPETLPMVHLQDSRKYVCNPDGVLSPQAVAVADSLLLHLEQKRGVETVVVAVKRIEGGDPYTFGMALSRKYGIGRKEQDSGLIIILATDDRKYYILIGKGLEGTLPDAICRRVENRQMLPALKKRDWDNAIVQTVYALARYVEGDKALVGDKADSEDNVLDMFLGLCIALLFGGALIFMGLSANRKGLCPKCRKGHLRIVKRTRVRTNDGAWCLRTLYRCPKCGHEKTEYEDDNRFGNTVAGGMMPPVFFGGFGGHGSGGGLQGGSFGGGSFGGGGSGGSF